jgi:hypothetical protein
MEMPCLVLRDAMPARSATADAMPRRQAGLYPATCGPTHKTSRSSSRARRQNTDLTRGGARIFPNTTCLQRLRGGPRFPLRSVAFTVHPRRWPQTPALPGVPASAQSYSVPYWSSSSMKTPRLCWEAATAIEAAVMLFPEPPISCLVARASLDFAQTPWWAARSAREAGAAVRRARPANAALLQAKARSAEAVPAPHLAWAGRGLPIARPFRRRLSAGRPLAPAIRNSPPPLAVVKLPACWNYSPARCSTPR